MELHGKKFFSNQEEMNALNLFKHFCNNLYLGQWEIAATCIHQLHHAKLDLNIHDLLKDLIQNPVGASLKTASIQTPYHLAWLCLQVTLGRTLQYEDEWQQKWKEMIEFNILLIDVCNGVGADIVEDLYLYHKASLEDGCVKSSNLELQDCTKNYLGDKLYEYPEIGNLIVTSLTDKDNQLYVCSFINCLQRIITNLAADKENEFLCKKLYEVLTLFDPGYECDGVEQIFKSLLNLMKSEKSRLSIPAVYSALSGRQNQYLIELYVKLEYEQNLSSISTGALVSELGFDSGALLSDSEKSICRLLMWHDKAEMWKNIFIHCFRHNENFLEVVLNAAFSLIKAGEYEQLKGLFKQQEIVVLKPMVLLLGWNYCFSCTHAKNLLQVLWDSENSDGSKLLGQACKKLIYQVDLVQWCLEKARPLLVASGAPTTRHDRATEMFQGLETHSLLYVLHHATQLSSLEPSEVLDILQKRPLSNECAVVCQSKLPQPKSVRFEEITTEPLMKQPLCLEQERDISIFYSYCAMKCFMDAVYFCVDSANMNLQQRKSDLEQNDGNSNEADDCQSIYQRMVIEKINSGKQYLSKIYPITYRVEILENIFSLLFVTHEDIQEIAFMPHSDSENDLFDHDDVPSKAPSLELSLQSADISVTGTQDMSEGPIQQNEIEDIIDRLSTLKQRNSLPEINQELITSLGSDCSSIRYDEPFIEANQEAPQSMENAEEMLIAAEPTRKISSFGFYSITKRGLKDISGSEAKVSQSGELSTASTTTSCLSKLGFVANDYVVRDVLAALKDCAIEAGGAKFGLLQTDSCETRKTVMKSDVEKELSKHMKCAISEEELQSRTSQFTQYVSEALWRFQLIIGDDPVVAQPEKVHSDFLASRRNQSFSDDDHDLWNESYEYDTNTTSRRKLRKAENEKSCGEKVRGSSMSGRDSESQNPDFVSTTNRRPKKRRQSPASSKCSNKRQGVISKMLASKETLLNMCLRRGHFAQANQVIKFFSMDDVSQAKEMEFAVQYQGAVRRLQAMDSRRRQTSPAVFTKTRPAVTKINLQAIRTVAAAAEASTLIGSIADEVLSSSSLPIIPDSALSKLENQSTNSEFQIHINPEHIPAMIVLDLATTACRTWDACESLLDLAYKRLPEKHLAPCAISSDVKKPRITESTIIGTGGFLSEMRSVIAIGNCESSIVNMETWKNLAKCNLNFLMTNVVVPLNVDNCQTYIAALVDIERSLIHVNKALKDVDKITDQVFIETVNKKGQKQKPSPTDRPIVHIAIKRMMQVLEKYVDSNGILRYFESAPFDEETGSMNFIQSLYDHVKVLAFLEAECQTRPKETILQPYNYFRMLNDSPTTILGKLMFVRKISPYKLEKVAQKLNLNLTKIIVNSCCPDIPCKVPHPKKLPRVCYGKIILNSCDEWNGIARHPEVVVRELLTKLITVMKTEAMKANCNCLFDKTVAKMLLQSNEVWDVLYATAELSFVDLRDLQDNKQKKCFYSNLLNLINIHTFLYQIEQENLKKNETFRILDKLMVMNNVSYCVGQLGCISQFELKFLICREGLLPPGCMDKILPDRLHRLDPIDPWAKYAPPAEPRLLFVTTSCSVSSPPVQVLTPELVRNQLETAMRSYLESNVTIDEEMGQVILPQMLVWYRYDFVGEKGDQYVADYEGLINFVVAHTSTEFNEPLKRLIDLDQVHEYSENIDKSGKKELPFKVKVEPYRYDNCIFFASESREPVVQLKAHRRSFSLPANINNDEDENSKPQTKIIADTAEVYNLRAVTLEYLKAKSALVATLISLVCSDEIDDIEDQMDETFFDSQSSEDSKQLRKGIFSRQRTSSDMSIVDVRSYRYQRVVDDFPSLHQYLLTFIVPIAAAQNGEILQSSDPVLKLLSASIDKSVRESMFCMHNSETFESDLESTINGLIKIMNWDLIICVINSIPLITMQKNPHWLKIKDFAICCVVSSDLRKRKEDIWHYLQQISDCAVQTRAVLGTLKFWPVRVCIDLLNMCRSLPGLADDLRDVVNQKLSSMIVYQKITVCAKSRQIKISVQQSRSLDPDDGIMSSLNVGELEQLLTWQSIVSVSSETPEKIIDVLSRSKEFAIARKWAQIHNISMEFCQTIEENCILNLLEENEPDVLTVCKSLEDLMKKDPEMTNRLCENLLLRFKYERSILLVAQFVLKYLQPMLTQKRTEELNLLCLGAKALQALPDIHKSDYHHLVTSPTLLFEQLLMNMRVEWAAKALQLIKPDLGLIHECELSEFDNVVIVYSTKALEFSVIQATDEDIKQRMFESTTTSSIQNLDLATDTSPSKLRRKSFAPRRASVAVAAFSVSPSSYSKNDSPLTRYLQSTPIPFVMPPEPPPKSKWVPDASVAECMVCQQERFSMFNRRHHCRRCGRVVCASCSSRTTMIRGISARTCDDCYEQIFKPRPELTDSEILQQKLKERLSGNTLSPVGSVGTTPPAFGSISGRSSDSVSLNLLAGGDMTWKLDTDESFNTTLREEFYYEQAPSTSLCISLLQLHSDPNECGQHMLKLCDDLSKMLKPIAPGVANPEVDYTLVISMMKYLLFNAKLKFMECNDSSGLDQCEQFKGKVDLVSLLVSANCQDIPSILELTKMDAVRRLRDRLIEDERLSLAMEVSMKYGIDPIGVWVAWGKACLKMGDYPTARAKFARCLKVPNDRHSNQMPSKLLCDIVDMIGNQRHQAGGKKAFMAQLKSFKDLVAQPPRLYTGDMILDDVQFDECLHYLKTYGNYLALVDFLRRHGYLQKALSFILEKKCSGEIFIDGILNPCMKSGHLSNLLDQMVMIDVSLDKWHTYLNTSCKYLYKMKFTNVLYEFQVFMKDYFRAAMTCINTFYEKGAKSYTDLLHRTNHLITAKQHMEAYLAMNTGSSGKAVAGFTSSPSIVCRHETPARLKQSLDEVTKYIETINYQIEITKFLQRHEVRNYDPYAASNSPSSMPVPTLFGNSKMKGALVIKVLVSGENITESFKIAVDVITKYKLNAPLLFTQVCRNYVKDRNIQKMHSLLKLIQKTDLCVDQDLDEIIWAILRVLVDDGNEGREIESLIKLIKDDANKIKALILCGKLKDAYLYAVKKGSVDDVKTIASVAAQKGQMAVKKICESWLQQQQR